MIFKADESSCLADDYVSGSNVLLPLFKHIEKSLVIKAKTSY